MTTIKATNVTTGAMVECPSTTAALVLALDYADSIPNSRSAKVTLMNGAWAYLSLCHAGLAAGMGVMLCADPGDFASLEKCVMDLLAKYNVTTSNPDGPEDDGDGGEEEEGKA